MYKTQKIRRVLGHAAIVGAAVGVFTLIHVTERGRETAAKTAAFWSTLTFAADEVEDYATLRDMSHSADVVVRGQFTSFGLSRQLLTDTPEDVVTLAQATLTVSEVIRGTLPEMVIPVEFVLPVPPEVAGETLDAQAKRLPNEELLLFLRDKREAESGLYRLVNSNGLWTRHKGKVDAPLSGDRLLHELDTFPAYGHASTDLKTLREEMAATPPELLEDYSVDEHLAAREAGANGHPHQHQHATPPAKGARDRYAHELDGVRTVGDLADRLRE